jgi:hypothetical protein
MLGGCRKIHTVYGASTGTGTNKRQKPLQGMAWGHEGRKHRDRGGDEASNHATNEGYSYAANNKHISKTGASVSHQAVQPASAADARSRRDP